MRSLGDAGWINAYVGLPYLLGGRDRSGLDCYGLAKLVYEEEYGVELPDWANAGFELKDRATDIASVLHSGEWEELETPTEGCFVVCYRTRAAHHIGIFLAGGVLHAHEGSGAVFEPLNRFKESFGRVVFGNWMPDE